MKLLVLVFICAGLLPAQTQLTPDETRQLATRMLQLMESAAVAIPGLTAAATPVKQNADAAFAQLERTPLDPAITWRFMLQVKAWLALSDSFPKPAPFPEIATQQLTELRNDFERIQEHFETLLTVQNQAIVQRDSDPNSLKRYAQADAQILPEQPKQPRVVFLGDSITDGWRLNEYFTGRDFINRGISGQTTLQMIARFRQDVASLNPKAVLILAGTNDIDAGISPEQIEQNFATLGDLAKARGIKPLFASILPLGDYHPPAAIQAIDQWLKGYCQMQGFTYVDYYSALVDPAGQMKPDLSDDGLNPNSKGYRVMAPIAVEAINRALQPQQPARR
jgi:lysophospholipase L1-like esterase